MKKKMLLGISFISFMLSLAGCQGQSETVPSGEVTSGEETSGETESTSHVGVTKDGHYYLVDDPRVTIMFTGAGWNTSQEFYMTFYIENTSAGISDERLSLDIYDSAINGTVCGDPKAGPGISAIEIGGASLLTYTWTQDRLPKELLEDENPAIDSLQISFAVLGKDATESLTGGGLPLYREEQFDFPVELIQTK